MNHLSCFLVDPSQHKVQLPAGKGVPNDQMQAFSDAVKTIEKQMKDSLTPDYVGVTLQQAALER